MGVVMESHAEVLRREDLRNVPKPRETFEVSELWRLHHSIVKRLTLGQGDPEIAHALGVSEQMVASTRSSNIVQQGALNG